MIIRGGRCLDFGDAGAAVLVRRWVWSETDWPNARIASQAEYYKLVICYYCHHLYIWYPTNDAVRAFAEHIEEVGHPRGPPSEDHTVRPYLFM